MCRTWQILGEDSWNAHSSFQNQVSAVLLVQSPKVSKCFILQNCSSSSIHFGFFDVTASECIQRSTRCTNYTTVQSRVCSKMEGVQYGGAHHQYGEGTFSETTVWNADQLHHEYGWRCAAQGYQNYSVVFIRLYLSGKMINFSGNPTVT